MRLATTLARACACAVVCLCALAQGTLHAQGLPPSLFASAGDNPYHNMTLEELLELPIDEEAKKGLIIYGFLRSNLEQVFHQPTRGADGATRYQDPAAEWSLPNAHLFGRAWLSERIETLFNLSLGQDNFELRNAWGNIQIDKAFQVRVGRMYTRFGLFNEKLDQYPTFLGIEPPELFDPDHLMLPRTSYLSLHGDISLAEGTYTLRYAVQSGNGEGGSLQSLPLAWDLRLEGDSVTVGTSGYVSSVKGTADVPSVNIGDGPPRGGIMPWMRQDSYATFGAFTELSFKSLIVQAAYWHAIHHAVRDPGRVLQLAQGANLNPSQRERFFGSRANATALSAADVITQADYSVQSMYLRVGYNFTTDYGDVSPYLFADWMSHPETIQDKTYGGDNEVGLSDDGQMWKPSVGVVYKPIAEVAIKLDSSLHIQRFNGEQTVYPEVRLDASFAFSTSD